MERKKRSVIWDFFTLGEDTGRFAVCIACQQSISLGRKTTNLVLHLRNKHKQNFSKYEVLKVSESAKYMEKTRKRQLKERAYCEHLRDINDLRVQCIHQCIREMIVMDCQLFLIVKEGGFIHLFQVLGLHYCLPCRCYMN